MEEKTPAGHAHADQPASPRPAMDVVPRRIPEQPAAQPGNQAPPSHPQPGMPDQSGVRPAPPPEAAADGKPEPQETTQAAPAKEPKKPPQPKQPKSGVGLAIAATVIIVLGLAALATYAYIKTRT